MITINFDKSKEITHEERRRRRDKAFAPWDIKATIPAEFETAEQNRQLIREKNAEIKDKIDNASDVAELENIYVNDLPELKP